MAFFKYINRRDTPSRQVLNFISETITELETNGYPFSIDDGESKVDCNWSVESEVLEVDDVKELILKRNVPEGELGEVFYVKLTNESVSNPAKYATFTLQMLYNYNTTTSEFEVKGPEVKYQCADETMVNTGRTRDHSIYVMGNIDNDRMALFFQADPVVSSDDYRVSPMYIGDYSLYEQNKDEKKGKILLTAGAVSKETTIAELKAKNQYFGVNTSVGNNTFQVLATKSGVRFQKHYPSFLTTAPLPGSAYIDSVLGDTGMRLDKQGFQASAHTDVSHVSLIYVTHGYEGYSGWLKDCIAVTNHKIHNFDTLTLDVDSCKYPEKTWKQEVYRFFAVDTEQKFFNSSANRDMAIAVLSELKY